MKNFCLILLFWGLAACTVARPSAPGALVSGKVAAGKDTVAGMRLLAYPAASPTLGGEAPFRSAPTVADGHFDLRLPAGEYYFLVRGPGYFSYYGRNPVTVPPAGLTGLNLGLVATGGAAPSAEAMVETGVVGRILHHGEPLAGATIFVYTDLSSRLKGMGYVMAGPSDAHGVFEIALPPGTYYLLARRRQDGGGIAGPLRAGDFVGYFPGNPVRLTEGAVLRPLIPMLEVPETVERLEANLFGDTSLQGRILNGDGLPLAGVRAVLYDDGQMLNRPLFVSQPTGADGTFVLSFPRGGTYFLAARNSLGGAPGPGDLFGSFDGTPDHSVQVATGEHRRDLEIRVEALW